MDFEIAIIGAGPAGLQAAISAATDGLSCVVIEKHQVGGAIRATPRLENAAFVAPGGITGKDFADTMEKNALAFSVPFIQGAVRSLAREGEEYRVHYATGDTFDSLTARFVILAVGGKWKDVHIKGTHSAIVNEVVQYGPEGATADWSDKDVVVVGGGPAAGQCIGEAARTARSVLVLLRDGFSCPQYLIDRIDARDNVRVLRNVDIHEFDHDGYVRYSLPPYSSRFSVPADRVFLCAGVTPDTSWLKHTRFGITEGGKVQTMRPSLETDAENVYCIGDARDGSTARVCSALGDGSQVITEIHQRRNKKVL